MSQRVAVVVDNMGTFGQTPDEERDSILEDLRRRMGLDPVLVHYGHDPRAIPLESQVDLLVVDYGMIATQTSDWTRYLLRWAEERPSSMLLIWSSMTADGFVDELADTLTREGQDVTQGKDWTPPWPANVRSMYSGNKWYASWDTGDDEDWLGASYEYVRRWFGIEGKTPIDLEVEEAGPLVAPDDLRPDESPLLLSDSPDDLVSDVVLEQVDAAVLAPVAEARTHKCHLCDEQVPDLTAHNADPEAARRHHVSQAIYAVFDEGRHDWQRLLRPQAWADGSTGDYSEVVRKIADGVASDLVVRLHQGEVEEEARRQARESRPRVETLVKRLVALREWVERDPDLKGTGWDHFGFYSRDVVPRAAGNVFAQTTPEPGRFWLCLSQGESKYVRSYHGGGIVAGYTAVEVEAYEGAIADAGFTILEKWNGLGCDSGSFVLGGVEVGPNVANGNGGRWSDRADKLPEGWS